METKQREMELVEEALNDVRSILMADGGDIMLKSISEDGTTVFVELMGMCVGCPVSELTLQGIVLRSIQKRLPRVSRVVEVS